MSYSTPPAPGGPSGAQPNAGASSSYVPRRQSGPQGQSAPAGPGHLQAHAAHASPAASITFSQQNPYLRRPPPSTSFQGPGIAPPFPPNGNSHHSPAGQGQAQTQGQGPPMPPFPAQGQHGQPGQPGPGGFGSARPPFPPAPTPSAPRGYSGPMSSGPGPHPPFPPNIPPGGHGPGMAQTGSHSASTTRSTASGPEYTGTVPPPAPPAPPTPLSGSRSDVGGEANGAHSSRADTNTNGNSNGLAASASTSASNVKQYRPYFSPAEIERMSAKQRGKLSVNREERLRQQACGFIDAVGARCGFPRKTIATAQTLYIRFHLFFPYKDFNYMDVCLSTLYVASKLHDTLKKPREIILASYPLRFPHLVKKSGSGAVDPSAVDPHVLEAERARVLGIERLVLEGVCFMFGVQGLEGVIRIARALDLSKEMTQAAWRVYIDCHRTLAPMSHPPHILALGSIYACALLSLDMPRPNASGAATDEAKEWLRIVGLLGERGDWQDKWSATADDIDEVAHATLDLHITITSTPPSDPQHALTPSPTSPHESGRSALARTAAGGAGAAGGIGAAGGSIANTAYRPIPGVWTLAALTELKVYLRERRPRVAQMSTPAARDAYNTGYGYGYGSSPMDVDVATPSNEDRENSGSSRGSFARNDVTTRFVWDRVVAA